jgi:anti-sigma regulatory factor (Ser/Thr protein kinase)
MNVGATERFQRRPEAVRAARVFLRLGLPARRSSHAVDQLVLAASEAMNNVIEHAAGGDFLVTVAFDGRHGSVVVTDAGAGFETGDTPTMPPADEAAGRGLAMMYALVDEVRIASGPAGTTVALRHDLTAEAAPADATDARFEPASWVPA